MVVDLERRLRLDRPVAEEVPDQSLLLGVDADHRQAGREVLPLQPGDVLELGVAVRMTAAHRLPLQRLPRAVAMLVEQLRGDVTADRRPQLGDPPGDLPPRQVGPPQVKPHRVARGVVLEHLEEVGLDRGVGRDQPPASAPLFRVRPVSRSPSPSSSTRPCRTVLGSQPRRAEMYSIPPWPSLAASMAAYRRRSLSLRESKSRLISRSTPAV